MRRSSGIRGSAVRPLRRSDVRGRFGRGTWLLGRSSTRSASRQTDLRLPAERREDRRSREHEHRHPSVLLELVVPEVDRTRRHVRRHLISATHATPPHLSVLRRPTSPLSSGEKAGSENQGAPGKGTGVHRVSSSSRTLLTPAAGAARRRTSDDMRCSLEKAANSYDTPTRSRIQRL